MTISRPPAFTRTARWVCAALIGCAAAVSPISLAATVEFKLHPQFKGREYRMANEMASALGAGTAIRGANGVFTLAAANEGAAAVLLNGLREQSTVLWAQSTLTDAALTRSAPESEFHGRMLALNLKDSTAAPVIVERLAARTGQAVTLKRVTHGSRALMVLPKGTTAATLAAMAVTAGSEIGVKSVDRVRVVRHQWLPNDNLWADQWALGTGVGGIRAAQAWDVTPSGSIAVAVIDTGIRSHPDLDGKRMSGYDMVSHAFISADGDGRDSDPTDVGDFDDGFECSSEFSFMSSWHGTHVAGIIAASTNNGQGMAGVAPNARIVPVRALGRCGGTSDDVADAIRWAAGIPVAGVPANANPARVINLSLGGYGPCSSNEQAAVDSALSRGAVVVVAAGNDATLAADFAPANCKGVIAVAASNLLGDLASYSNFGSRISVSAPGGDSGDLPGVLSTLNGGITQPAVPSYASYSGTSMAAPHVAGVVALMLTRDIYLTTGQILNRLQAASRAFPAGSDCAAAPGACGSGLLDAASVMARVADTRAPTDVTGRQDRVRLIELRDDLSWRHLLSSDPVEIAYVLSGQKGGAWVRTGFAIDTYSFTAGAQSLAVTQPVCRAQLRGSLAYTYSANVTECQNFSSHPGLSADGMVFIAALPNAVCPTGSSPAFEMVRFDALGYNLRTLTDLNEIALMLTDGWAVSRIAFCAPQ